MEPQAARILIVEDERVVARDIQRSLQRLGYDAPTTVASGEEAIACAKTSPPDLVLMDIRIEGDLNGIETARRIRGDMDVPVVFLTAYADSNTVEQVKDVQPYGYLLKPVRKDELRTTVDIALHKHRLDRELRERERWFSTTLSSIADAVITVNPEGHIQYLNPAAERLLGTQGHSARGQAPGAVVDLRDDVGSPMEPHPLEAALREHRVVTVPRAMLHNIADGRRIAVADSVAVVQDERQVLGAVMVLHDVTEQERLQAHVLTSDRMATIGMLAAGVAHEINNPLAAACMSLEHAVGVASTIAASNTSAEVHELQQSLRDANQACDRVRNIVHDLRVFSRAEAPALQEIDINAVMSSTLRLAHHEIRHRAQLVPSLAQVPPVLATESRLGQVFLNLLINAAQAIPDGRADEHKIEVSTRTASDGSALIEITDTGTGMTRDTMNRLFTPFFTTKSPTTGTGLGLMICRRIIDDFQGTVSIDSVLGQGTTVRIQLPAANLTSGTPRVTTPEPVAPVTRAKVLIIDDDPFVGSTLARLLRAQHDISVVERAESALARLTAGEQFDVILCDLMMPVMNGMELYVILSQQLPEQARRMVFMTGGAFTEQAQVFLERLGTPQLQKPFNRERAEEVIADVLARRGLFQAQ